MLSEIVAGGAWRVEGTGQRSESESCTAILEIISAMIIRNRVAGGAWSVATEVQRYPSAIFGNYQRHGYQKSVKI
jgi:hypothetical protein